jgi:phage tail-like protein
MATGSRVDPYRGFNFLVEIDGITQAGFTEVTGLDASTPAVEYRQGDFGTRGSSKLPGINTYSAIGLKRGITDSDELWKWRQTVIDGKVERKNGSIVLLDEKGTEKIRWNFSNAWPSKWTGPAFNATSTAVAVEALELTHEEVKRA